jgi:hypothetical protein
MCHKLNRILTKLEIIYAKKFRPIGLQKRSDITFLKLGKSKSLRMFIKSKNA